MTLEQINALTLEDTLDVILDRILDTSELPEGQKIYMLDQDESLPFYDRIIVHQLLVKPPLHNLQVELTQYKQELTVIEQARLDELARIQGLKDRFNALSDIRGAIAKLSLDIPNPSLELQRIIDENDEARLSALESAHADYLNELAASDAAELADKVAKSLVETCLGCVELVMKFNISNGLTGAQKDLQATNYADVFGALRDWRPGKAKSLISASNPDGTLVTQGLKDDLLAYLTSRGI